MLKDIRNLGNDLKRQFLEISNWPELTFNEEDKRKLSVIDSVTKIYDHSLIIEIDDNHSVIPSQYLLYSILIKEFAIALKNHLDVFDSYKTGKNSNEIGNEVVSGQLNLEALNLDSWSKSIALKPVTDVGYNFGAKSMINGETGNYKIRGTLDFFTSVILKIVNIPDASSTILGRLIYNLCDNIELYNYIEKRYSNSLPFLIKEKNGNYFAYRVFSYLFQYDKLNKLKDFIIVNDDKNFRSIKINDLSLTSIFKANTLLQTNEELSMGNKLRFSTSPIHFNEENEYLYFSTEWTFNKNSRLDITTLQSIIENQYPEFSIVNEDDYFIFKSVSAIKFYKKTPAEKFQLQVFNSMLSEAGLVFDSLLVTRFVGSLLTKPFAILTGLSGSGKTMLAHAFARWICLDKSQYCLVPVGADWTNREPLLGYPNALKQNEYVNPENGVLKMLINAGKNPHLPYFLILDEMNLSHVERYFADFLSVMESKDEKISLHSYEDEIGGIPSKFMLPSNLFIIGTVNIDETTNMFSPKVLDRANTIEFRVNLDEMESFLDKIRDVNLDLLNGKGAAMAGDFLKISSNREFKSVNSEEINKELVKFFGELRKSGAEFGYRSATEILRLINKLSVLDSTLGVSAMIDIAIMQKLLPKLHGSRRKLCPVLETLGGFCLLPGSSFLNDVIEKVDFDFKGANVKYSLSLEKIARMYRGAVENGFASFAEA